ncbi:hypothetical protein CISIN_1g041174mg [Citrus sinensis]|uniref:Uncharacterized protein n=1 Tax=Citrus sinensis TaxID=2711 RepID=A0A067F7D9_CITSI|nr:hypothetical protein CISIN_1g041174mg [Citrus sinensis]
MATSDKDNGGAFNFELIRPMVFWKNDEPIIDAEDDGCGAVTILVFNNLKILTIKDVVEMLKITQAA